MQQLPGSPTPRLSVAGTVLLWGVRLLWTSLVIAIPVLGVWTGSSLAAYGNHPIWVALAVGLLLFPGLPVAWEAWATRSRKKKILGKRRPDVLSPWDRLVLRTLVLNLVLVGGLLWRAPDAVFTALSGRGDWMLEPLDHSNPTAAQAIRPWIFAAADGFQWLYDAAHHNEYEDLIAEDGQPHERPTPSPGTTTDAPTEVGGLQPSPEPGVGGSVPDPPPDPRLDPWQWPQPEALHPAVVSMPASAKASVLAVGQYLLAAEPDPYRRAKAIHDFAANHVAYDGPSYTRGEYPPQDADHVLRTGLAVCAGYANLAKAIADVTGDTMVVVVGDARTQGGDISGEGHAWNAVKIEQRWYLMDATWDSGSLDGEVFNRTYRSDYLFVPPEIMGITHFPDDPSWQLRPVPVSRGEFFRAPVLRPGFYADGFVLEQPTRSQVTVDREFQVHLGNPRGNYVLARYGADPRQEGKPCEVIHGPSVKVRCTLPAAGKYHVSLFGSPQQYGSFHFLGEFEVNARG